MKQILTLFHGMVPQKQPLNHFQEYRNLLDVLKQRPRIANEFSNQNTVGVEYGHRDNSTSDRLDQLLQPAQAFIHESIGHEGLAGNQESGQHRLTPAEELAEVPSQVTRQLFSDAVKEQLLLLGMSDAVFYCSPAGEDSVRAAVYSQVLTLLEGSEGEPIVKLHFVAHSLGVTVAYDFLFGLFAPPDAFQDGVGPSFLRNPAIPGEAKEAYKRWRLRASQGTLLLGSFSSTAGQLPLTLQRSEKVIRTFSIQQRLDPSVLGLKVNGQTPVWRSFFDRDDVLGFPSRALFQQTRALEEYQVNAGSAIDAHSKMWSNPRVTTLIGDLIVSNL